MLSTPQPLGEAHVWRVDVDQAKLRVRNVPETMRDARRRRHEASGPGAEDIVPDSKLGLAREHIERVDVIVVGMRINSLELGAKAELDDLELWKLPENPVMSLPAHESFPAFSAERDDAVHGHVASLSDRVSKVPRAYPRVMDFFVYSRVGPSAADIEHGPTLDEEHWSYMDRFAEGMIARGPTLAADRATWAGSVHILDLPSVEAAHQFVEHEPYNRAGLFDQHLIRRFDNLLGRTMWEFLGGTGDPRFLIIAQVKTEGSEAPPSVPFPDLTALESARLIVYGDLLALSESTSVGVALALEAPTRQAVDRLLWGGRARPTKYSDTRVLDWEFGGRR